MFLWWESRAAHPLLDLRYLRVPAFLTANLVAFAAYFATFAVFFFTALYLQEVAGYNGYRIALTFAPMTVLMIVASLLAGRWTSVLGPRWSIVAGCVLFGAGLLLTAASLSPSPAYLPLAGALALTGAGIGTTVVPATSAALAAVPARRSGMAASAANTSREIGAVTGVAILGALVNSRLQLSLTGRLRHLGIPATFQSIVIHAIETGAVPSSGNSAAPAAPRAPGTPRSFSRSSRPPTAPSTPACAPPWSCRPSSSWPPAWSPWSCCAGAGRPPGRMSLSRQQAPEVSGLPDVLQVVGDHADQPDAQGHGRVPARVHDPVQVLVGQAGQVAERPLVDGVVIAGKQLSRLDLDRRHLAGPVPVTGRGRQERQPEAVKPAVRQPHLLGARHVRDMIVLDPGQVPDQPGDGVRGAVGPVGQLAGRQAVQALMHLVMNPAEAVGQNVCCFHGAILPRADRHADPLSGGVARARRLSSRVCPQVSGQAPGAPGPGLASRAASPARGMRHSRKVTTDAAILRDVVAGDGRRLHAAAGSGHHVASPLGAWLLLALCAPAVRDEAGPGRALAEILGCDPATAARLAAALLDRPHPQVAAAVAAWTRDRPELPPAVRCWQAGLPAAVAAGPVPDQAGADAWARDHTFGLIERFPVRISPATYLVLASALATRVSWQQPFALAPAAELGEQSPWSRQLGQVLATPARPGAAGHRALIAVTPDAGDVIVHLAQARDGLLVASVAAAAEVPSGRVLAAAQRIGTAAVTGAEIPLRPLADLRAGEAPLWRIWDEAALGAGGRADRFTAVLPAWSARSELDLADPALGFAAAAAALGGGDPWTAAQSAQARYTRTGFAAAAVTGMAVTASARRPPAGQRRAAQLRFGSPYAVVAVAADAADGPPGPWHGLPVFSAWVTDPQDAADGLASQ